MSEPQNQTIDVVDSALKKLVTEVLLEKAMKEAIKEVAWLAMPVINPIFALIMRFAAKFLYKKAALEAAFIIIDKQTEHQRKEYEQQVEELKIAIKEGNNEEIERKREEARKRLRDLISYNIS